MGNASTHYNKSLFLKSDLQLQTSDIFLSIIPEGQAVRHESTNHFSFSNHMDHNRVHITCSILHHFASSEIM